MKRTMKKVFALALAVMLVMALTVSAFATEYEDGNKSNYTITVTPSVPTPGTFSAYQIFTGDLAIRGEGETQTKILSNIVWGSAVDSTNEEAIFEAIHGINEIFASCNTAAEVAKALDNVANNSEIAQKFADAVGPLLKTPSNAVPAPVVDGKATIEVTAPGYYMVKSNAPTDGNEGYAATRYILQVVGDVKIDEKASVPSVEKKVGDINDSTGTTETGKTADYDIGDAVPFTLTGTLPSTYADYETYKYVFHDTLSKGLTYNYDAEVFVVNDKTETKVTEKFAVQYEGTALTISCENLMDITEPIIDKNSEIVVRYTATLNENAEIGNPGNPNTVYLEFSNNPNAGGEDETGTTPPDKVVVFTFELDVKKVDQDNEDLAGAQFALYKKVLDGTPDAVALNEKGLEDLKGTEKIWLPITDHMTFTSPNLFYYKGLDDGDYKLVETKTPTGYNTIKPVDFTVTATHTSAPDELKLESVIFNSTTEGVKITSGDGTEGGGSIGIGSTDIVNNRGTQLPSTGGMGTTILYIVGGVLAVGAAVILVVRKRMQSRQQSNQ